MKKNRTYNWRLWITFRLGIFLIPVNRTYNWRLWVMIIFRLVIFLIPVIGISYLTLGSLTGVNRIAIPLHFDGFCQVEGPNNACYIKYGAEKVNGELIKISQPIAGLATTERWQSIFQLPIGIFDKVLCTEINQPSSLIQGAIVRLNGETNQTISQRKCDITLIKNGEVAFNLKNPKLEGLEVDLQDKKFQEVMRQSTLVEFVPGPMKKASELNSTIFISVELKNRNYIWIVYFFAYAISTNLIFIFLDFLKFIFNGAKSFIK